MSLINVDTKIGSKAIARRLQDVIKGKSIFGAVRAIDDISEFTEREKIQGLMGQLISKQLLIPLVGILC